MESARSHVAPYARELARRHGWQIELHPDGGFAGQIRLASGANRYFVRSSFDINRGGAIETARDKALTKFYLSRLGYPTLPGEVVFAPHLAAEWGPDRAIEHAPAMAERLGYPVIVKPNRGHGGLAVERIGAAGALAAAIERTFAYDDIVLIEAYAGGLRDVRVLVLDGSVLLAYERWPPAVVGDDRSTIRELAALRGSQPPEAEIQRKLQRDGLSLDSVPRAGAEIVLLDAANLTRGGAAVEITDGLHPFLAKLAVDMTRDLGLRYCGVDLLTDRSVEKPSTVFVLELNGSPTIHHFARLCALDDSRLMSLFERLFLAMVE